MNGLILLNGRPPSEALLKAHVRWADKVICADGAANWAIEMGVHPDALIGDMDSISGGVLSHIENSGIECLRYPADKDKTDAQLALDLAVQDCAQVIFLGALGGRIDHILGNMQILIHAKERGIKAEIKTDNQKLVITDRKFFGAGKSGDLVSIIPWGSGVRVRTEGLVYPLDGDILPMDYALGISNVIRNERFEVEVSGGWAVIIKTEADKLV